MRRIPLVASFSASIILVVLLIAMSLTPSTTSAEVLLQDIQSMAGMNIYFSEANGEGTRFDRTLTGLSRYAGLLRRLGANLFTLEWRKGIPEDANLIVIPGPTRDLDPDQVARLWSYLDNGGRVLILLETVSLDRRDRPYHVFPEKTGFFSLTWADLGLRGLDNVVVVERGSGSTESTSSSDGSSPLISEFTANGFDPEHPITADLSGELTFFTTRSFEIDLSIDSVRVTPLVFSDTQYYGETDYAQYLLDNTTEFNIGDDTPRSALPLAVSVQNDNNGGRMVVIGDSEFVINGRGFLTSPAYSASFIYPENVRFMLNSTSWLLEARMQNYRFSTPGPTETATITPSPTATATPTVEMTATPES